MPQPTTDQTVRDALVRVFSQLDEWFDRPVRELEARPGYPGAWSIAEHLEHVFLANHFLLLTIGKGCAKARRRAGLPPIPEAGIDQGPLRALSEVESDLDPLASIADPDAFEWSPPSHMMPTGTREPAELRGLLRSQCRDCLELLAGMPRGEGRLCTIRMSVHGLGRLDMYQWLYFLAQHASYHLTLMGRRSAP